MIPGNVDSSENDIQLDRLLMRYRQATEFGDASPNFMPELWARIESRRSPSLMIERVGRVFAAGAVALAILAGLFTAFAPQRPTEDTWVEAIASHQLAQNAMYFEPVRLSPAVDHAPTGTRTVR